jgi:4-aminobutyrate aminotransferase/diaminobutyrate-pyruvate transaminase/4-aminobutyrate aminotransferase/(S)-3-amino-2-methylpropionate transaminase
MPLKPTQLIPISTKGASGHKYHLTPVNVPKVKTKYRRIATAIPAPESLAVFEKLAKYEPISMSGQPPIIWDRAKGIQVYDKWGNMWLDWSSCVLVSNVGHGRPEIGKVLKKIIDRPLLATYVFPHAERADLCELLSGMSPPGLSKVFLLSTGSEATECSIKLARTYGVKKGGKRKYVIVSFGGAFHGRTFGAQMAGGIPALKEWIVQLAPGFVQVPFPDGFRNEDVRFELFEETLRANGVEPADVAGVISESYQGIGPNFFPDDYARKLGAWCKKNDVVLIMDEVQAGFGRTGKLFAFEHYDFTPDLICCGKGISSTLPISALIGRPEIMDLYAPGSMTSTHSASPLPVVAAIENLKILKKEKLTENAARLGVVLKESLERIQRKYSRHIGAAFCRGFVGGLLMIKSGTKDPDGDTALQINEKCFQKGLLMFAPVGLGGGCIKIAPPLTTPRDALEEGISVLEEACNEVLG